MELNLGIGIGKLKFGMKPAKVKNILGNSDIEKVDKEDENRLILVFNKERLRLTFYKNEDNKLGYIITSNPNLIYNGIKILNSNIDYIKKEVFSNIITEWEIEDYSSFITHFNENFWLTLDSEFETVTNFELGVPFDNGEDYRWPN